MFPKNPIATPQELLCLCEKKTFSFKLTLPFASIIYDGVSLLKKHKPNIENPTF